MDCGLKWTMDCRMDTKRGLAQLTGFFFIIKEQRIKTESVIELKKKDVTNFKSTVSFCHYMRNLTSLVSKM